MAIRATLAATSLRAALGVLLAGGAAAALAAPPASLDVERGFAAVMQLPLNKSQVLRIDRPFAKVLVGSDDIADAIPASASSIYVMGKAVGSTNLTILDSKGALVSIVDIIVGPDAQGLKRQLAELLPNEHIGVTVSNDSLILDGRVASAGIAERAATIAETYAPKKVANLLTVDELQQVMLEVRFAEMNRGTVKQLGISQVSYGTSAASAGTPGNSTALSVAAINPGANPYSAIINLLGNSLQVRIDALEQQGLIHTLAQPNLVAMSGESASFLAGGEFPVPTGGRCLRAAVDRIQAVRGEPGVRADGDRRRAD